VKNESLYFSLFLSLLFSRIVLFFNVHFYVTIYSKEVTPNFIETVHSFFNSFSLRMPCTTSYSVNRRDAFGNLV